MRFLVFLGLSDVSPLTVSVVASGVFFFLPRFFFSGAGDTGADDCSAGACEGSVSSVCDCSGVTCSGNACARVTFSETSFAVSSIWDFSGIFSSCGDSEIGSSFFSGCFYDFIFFIRVEQFNSNNIIGVIFFMFLVLEVS